MKVLLIQPPFTILRTEAKKCHPPLGLAYLAGALKDNHNVEVLDSLAEGYESEFIIDRQYLRYGLSLEEIGNRIKAFSPEAIGVSFLFSSQAHNAHAIARLTKEINKNIIVIAGGAHCSALPEKVLADVNIDFVVIGEGETTLKDLLEHLEDSRGCVDIEGLGFKHNGCIKINPKKKYLEDLDSLALPAWEIFPLEKYAKINNPHGSPARATPFLPVITSRGCPFECIFCSIHTLWGKTYRKRSVSNVLSEIEFLVQRLGVKEILFEDDNLTLDKERAKKIFQGIIDRQFSIVWSVPNGVAVQTLDEEMLGLMRRSGCYRLSLGIESGDKDVLKQIIKKPIDLAEVKPVINKARQLGMETAAFFVVGLPGETSVQLRNTLRFARQLGADNINFFFATPLPGTLLNQICQRQQLIPQNLNFTRLKSDYPSFATGYSSKEELYAIIVRQRLLIHLSLLLRHPGRFLSKLLMKLKLDPAYFKRYKMQFQKKPEFSPGDTQALIQETASRYAVLWSSYKQEAPPKKYHFDAMQDVIPQKIVRGRQGLEIGCGCGWDTLTMAERNPLVRIIGMDVSDGVYLAAQLSSACKNTQIIKASATAIPLKDRSCDFVYSFGVLHHIPNYKMGFLEATRVLKSGCPCFFYLYEDHVENKLKYYGIQLVTKMRKVTVKMHPRLLFFFSCLISPIFVVLFSFPARILKRFKSSHGLYEKIPFNFGTSLFSLRGDIYDRFSAPIEHRFSRNELSAILNEYNYRDINFTRLEATAGWVVWGYKR